jgi:hypothetical protein
MKWGVRRYQNEDGTLTPAGKKRYAEASKYLNAGYKNLQNQMYGIEGVAQYRMAKARQSDPNADVNKIKKDTYNDFTLAWLESDGNFKKARQIINRYAMTEWNDDIREEMDSYNKAVSSRSIDPYLERAQKNSK